jgi:hypothetical protein
MYNAHIWLHVPLLSKTVASLFCVILDAVKECSGIVACTVRNIQGEMCNGYDDRSCSR